MTPKTSVHGEPVMWPAAMSWSIVLPIDSDPWDHYNTIQLIGHFVLSSVHAM